MKQQVFNPYLPSWEYIPDGEPYVFGDRVYVYGSHDSFGAPIFCVKDYVCWSVPVTDLSDWRYEGVIYRKNQDPSNKLGIRCLYAPDVTQGPDENEGLRSQCLWKKYVVKYIYEKSINRNLRKTHILRRSLRLCESSFSAYLTFSALSHLGMLRPHAR